ncbi:MAG: tRNA 2-thiouridine(34) synthase MnmA [Oscillospiraceae bacterium]|jgi:tRNA-specific 2-thiouridylase|nr:tRNA 2-thiouridine(34) synthase MnmA [Oscillospiraceae bacterium]
MKKVLVGMSGGVDSSVAALLLKQHGFDVYGVTLKLRPDEYMQGSLAGGCCSLDDIEDARRVCAALDIPHYVFNFVDLFSKKVIDYFANEYIIGRTPNPCIACNRYIKFEELLSRALAMGMDYVATGHYARIKQSADGLRRLYKAPSPKDQSYALFSINQQQLAHTLFPLGDIEDKALTRRLAQEHKLPVAFKPDSQEICFVENNDYAAFLQKYGNFSFKEGNFVDRNGHILGRHKGIAHYTIGQRKGLGISFGKPMYVTNIDAKAQTVTLGEEGEQYSQTLIADDANWITQKPEEGARIQAKIRYSAKPAAAVINHTKSGGFSLCFDEPQRSITPGQAVVIYDGDEVLGGGSIVN